MQHTDLCAICNRKVLGAPASQKCIPKLILKPVQVTEHIMEVSTTTNMNGGENAKDSRKHLYTAPSFKNAVFKT